MGLRIANNIAAMGAHRWLTVADAGLSRSLERLSSGYRINRAADDAAGLAISSSLRANIASYVKASENTSQGMSMVQVAEGAMNEINNILTRLKELATQAASANLTSDDRAKLNTEATALENEIDRIANSTKYGDTQLIMGTFGAEANLGVGSGSLADAGIASSSKVDVSGVIDTSATYTITDAAGTQITLSNGTVTQTLSGISTGAQTINFDKLGVQITLDSNYSTSAELDAFTFTVSNATQYIQVGTTNDGNDMISISMADMRRESKYGGSVTFDVDLTTVGGAQTALNNIDTAIEYVAEKRGDLGSIQNRLGFAAANLASTIENTQAAESVIRDVDMAAEMTTFTKNQILLQAGTAMLAQANMAPQAVLQLMG
ncbi:MAG: flagellin [Deltaproteobacteria bacterium]|nr:flagellin [Deltaproteobacteria bacterium]MBW2018927.1 flagellin [Deltaproteobacteria bacterium]MBW2073142.1 flagellin [Deltaproteobacteria bacterium]